MVMLRCHSYGVLLLLLLLGPIRSIALSSSSRRETRYFTQELELPPLPSMQTGINNEYTKSIPLVYTNDPKIVSNWLGEQISSHGGCILGLDVEVGYVDVVL